jgi:hypothetical protein
MSVALCAPRKLVKEYFEAPKFMGPALDSSRLRQSSNNKGPFSQELQAHGTAPLTLRQSIHGLCLGSDEEPQLFSRLRLLRSLR